MCLFSTESFQLFIWINFILGGISGIDDSKKLKQPSSDQKCPVWYQFACSSGQSCIDNALLCDGLKDCPDGSDETAQQCSKRNCLNDEFKCAYGGCISLSAKCDGRTDCADNSDETNADCPLIINEVIPTVHCNANQFQCISTRKCIDKRLLCNGKGDCEDNSDETVKQCGHTICPNSTFRCEYGACIDAVRKCDKKKDCLDGSDEFEKTCSPADTSGGAFYAFGVATPGPEVAGTVPSTTRAPTTCTLPSNTVNFQMKINCPKETPKCANSKSKMVGWNTEVKYRCKDGYAAELPDTEFVSVCWKGFWLPAFTTCKRTCPTLKPINVDLTCSLNGVKVQCNGNLKEGTSVRPRCKAHYHETRPIHYRQIHCESSGKWTDELFSCVPECGKATKNVKKLISYASPEKFGEAPWHVAIYYVRDSTRPLICGGTLISPYLVVSAAHCFFDESVQKLNNASHYAVVVSKFSRKYSQRDNRFTKVYQVREIILPTKAYTGFSTRYASDIAILWLKEKVSISRAVLPACVPWTEDSQFNPGDGILGKLTGFGKNENDTGSESLLTAQLPYISREKCIKSLNDDFRDIVTLDKFCAGSTNGAGAREGDSGGGLLFRDPDLGVYFLQGVVSIKEDSSSSVAVFTSINNYLEWMDQVRIRVQKLIS